MMREALGARRRHGSRSSTSARPTPGPPGHWPPITRSTQNSCEQPQAPRRRRRPVRSRPPRMGPMDRLRGRLQPLLRPPPRLGVVLLQRQRHPGSRHRRRVADPSGGRQRQRLDHERALRGPRPSAASNQLHLPKCSQISGRSRSDTTPCNSASAWHPSWSPRGTAKRKHSKCSSPPPRSRPTPSSMAPASTDVRIGQAQGRFVCEITDRGPGFDDPAAGYLAPRDGVGSGLWVARQLTWRIEFLRSPRGFTARIWL